MIDIVVPIYNAYDSVEKCLYFLSKHSETVNKVYLINDASSDSNISVLAKKYCTKPNWSYFENKENLGFVKTANIGLKKSKEATILLNSDAFVTVNWLDGFLKVIQLVPRLGTATSWSNNAEILSFPNFLKENSILNNPNELSHWLYKEHAPTFPEIPTAVGFCMLISKQAKKQVGYFDESQFGQGYGEENDYSLRVKESGLLNILCDNSYVTHIGNQSFKEYGLKPDEETMKRLSSKHPNYINIIDKFIKKDPLKGLRLDLLNRIKISKPKLYQRLIDTNE